MLVPLSWLLEYTKTKLSAEEIAERLTLAGTKVEAIHKEEGEKVFELEITPNRPDCLSVLGIAREVAAVLGGSFKPPAAAKNQTYGKEVLTIVVKEARLCPVYTSALISGIKIKPSSGLIQKRLRLAGIRPINNVVDITNYVMVLTGQPMHAFDADKICGEMITIRRARQGERVTPLDGKERVLPEGAIVIEDKEKIVDLAGIMGGQNSEISDGTGRILLHVPVYDPVAIRRTTKAIKLRTEAATIYEKTIDLEQTRYAFDLAVGLLEKYAGGRVVSPIYDEDKSDWKPARVILTCGRVEKVLGIKMEVGEAERILTGLGCEVKRKIGGEKWEMAVIPPSFRRDLEIPEDLVEELVRIYGYNRLPRTLPTGEIPEAGLGYQNWEYEVAMLLADLGFTQIWNIGMVSDAAVEKSNLDPGKHLSVLRPMSEDFALMRQSLVPGLLAMAKTSENLGRVELFEIGKVFWPKKTDLPEQPEFLTIVTNNRSLEGLAGVVEAIWGRWNIRNFQVGKAGEVPGYLVRSKTREYKGLGYVGVVKPTVLAAWGIDQPVVAAEINFGVLKNSAGGKRYQPLAKYPPVIEDLSLVVPEEVDYVTIKEIVEKVSDLVRQVKLVDTYGQIYTLRLHFQHPGRNLTSEEVGKVKQKILGQLAKKLGVRLKG